MARFVFLTFDGGGNHPPTIGIATEMQRRGHSVTVVGYETQRNRFQDAGLRFEVFPRTGSYVQASGQEMEVRMALLREIANPDQVIEVRDLAAGYDGILVDTLMPVRVFTAAALPQPTAVLFHTAAAFFKPSPMLSVFLGAINPVLQSHGLNPVTNLLDYPAGIDRAIVATLPELDEYSQEAGPRWHWVGPVPGPAPESLDSPLFEPGDQRPLVVVGLTSHTAYGSQTERLQRILDALSTLAVRVVAGTGIAIDRTALRVPSNAVVRDYVPHRAVMLDAAACVTHAGHGTLTEALMRGVPLVCLPNPMSDQTYLAQRVKALGAGVQIDQDSPAEAISEAVQTVLSTSSFRSAARSLQARIGEGGAARAAEVLEAMVSVPVSVRGKKG